MIDTNSYALNSSINGVSLDQNGTFTVDTSEVISAATLNAVSIVVGSQTFQSPYFTLQIKEEDKVEKLLEQPKKIN